MSNIALIIAGGSGNRMHQDIPKQFLTVNERPVIVYTLEAFEKHPSIDSIAVACLEGSCGPDDIVLIHDAIRPMISPEIISDSIRVTKKYGNATAVIPCAEAMMQTEDGLASTGSYPRDKLKRTQTPQTFFIKDICSLHRRALEAGITNSVASCTLMIEMGEKVYFSAGSEKNIKLTTVEDIDIFKALLSTERSSWLK